MPVQTQWEHAHQCQVCGHIIRIDDIDAKIIATESVTCRKCDASASANLKIFDERQVSESIHSFGTRANVRGL